MDIKQDEKKLLNMKYIGSICLLFLLVLNSCSRGEYIEEISETYFFKLIEENPKLLSEIVIIHDYSEGSKSIYALAYFSESPREKFDSKIIKVKILSEGQFQADLGPLGKNIKIEIKEKSTFWNIISWSTFPIIYILLFVVGLVDILKSKFNESNLKLIWILVLLGVPLLGVLLYFIIGRKQRIKK